MGWAGAGSGRRPVLVAAALASTSARACGTPRSGRWVPWAAGGTAPPDRATPGAWGRDGGSAVRRQHRVAAAAGMAGGCRGGTRRTSPGPSRERRDFFPRRSPPPLPVRGGVEWPSVAGIQWRGWAAALDRPVTGGDEAALILLRQSPLLPCPSSTLRASSLDSSYVPRWCGWHRGGRTAEQGRG